MARRLMRRRRRYTWLPNLGGGSDVTLTRNTSGTSFILPGVGPDPVYLIFPLTFDAPTEPADTVSDQNLGQIIQNEYVIERIVGTTIVTLAQAAEEAGVLGLNSAVLVTQALFVARAEDESTSQDRPIGSSSNLEIWQHYSPQSPQNTREPFMWRRSWLLGAAGNFRNSSGALYTFADALGATPDATSPTLTSFPNSNVMYGDVMSGPHIDVRSVRRVRQDERVWLITAAQNWPVDTTSNTAIRTIVGFHDTRILGQLRRPHNKSSF